MSYCNIKTELKIEYQPEQDEIYFDCPMCQNRGCLKRQRRKPNLLMRFFNLFKRKNKDVDNG